jgi:hypothetical protein
MILNNRSLLSLLLIALLITLSTSCKKDDGHKPSITGSWVMEIGSGQDIPVQLTLYSDGSLEWVPLIPTENHSLSLAKHTFSNGVLTITNDPDCSGTGRYTVTLQGVNMNLTVIEDDCEPRISALVGDWTRKDLMIEQDFRKIWRKSMVVSDEPKDILFYLQHNGVFEWLINEETSLYKSSLGKYVVGPDYLAVFSFLDCHLYVGYYSYLFSGGGTQLVISNVEDDCTYRIAAIAGSWELVDIQ